MIQLEKTVYLYSNSAHVLCPVCGASIKSDRELVIEEGCSMIVTCKTCSEQFTIAPSRRAYERHALNAQCKGFSSRQGALQLTIADISMGGIGFVSTLHNLKVDDSLQLRFNLDSKTDDMVVVMVQICHVDKETRCGSLLMHDYTDSTSLDRIESYCRTHSTQGYA